MKFLKQPNFFLISNLLLVDQTLKQRTLASTSNSQKMVLTLPITKMESSTNKFFNNFDSNVQIKGVLFFYFFSAIFPQISYKHQKSKSDYSFQFKINLVKNRLNEFLAILFVENLNQSSSTALPASVLSTPAVGLAINFKVPGNLFESIDYMFDTLYTDLTPKSLTLQTTLALKKFWVFSLMVKTFHS